ncbi:hypothetical protein KSP40_PGU008986 [Platanthera guangdongensis]|uniref:Uncharacterized protein n=1 Tax=Platanthera guangdongensis TaxID=2320717 RepID=A0ABR2LLE0_9ASPA
MLSMKLDLANFWPEQDLPLSHPLLQPYSKCLLKVGKGNCHLGMHSSKNVHKSFPFNIAMSWKGPYNDSENGALDHQHSAIVFPKGNLITSVKTVTFYRYNTFFVDVVYANINDPCIPSKISTYPDFHSFFTLAQLTGVDFGPNKTSPHKYRMKACGTFSPVACKTRSRRRDRSDSQQIVERERQEGEKHRYRAAAQAPQPLSLHGRVVGGHSLPLMRVLSVAALKWNAPNKTSPNRGQSGLSNHKNKTRWPQAETTPPLAKSSHKRSRHASRIRLAKHPITQGNTVLSVAALKWNAPNKTSPNRGQSGLSNHKNKTRWPQAETTPPLAKSSHKRSRHASRIRLAKHPITQVKRARAGVVLGWVTSWEVPSKEKKRKDQEKLKYFSYL